MLNEENVMNYAAKPSKNSVYETLIISRLSMFAAVCWVAYRKQNESNSLTLTVELFELYFVWESSALIIILFTSAAVLNS